MFPSGAAKVPSQHEQGMCKRSARTKNGTAAGDGLGSRTGKRMKIEHPNLQIRVYAFDGSMQMFTQNDSDLVNRSLLELHPAFLFKQDQITIAHEDGQTTFLPPLVARVDLITDRLSVWDFPFFPGALMELTEAEFNEGVRALREQTGLRSETLIFLDMEMVSGQHSYLWMQIIAGLSAARLIRIYSLFKERRLIFGLRTGGVGALNLANLVRFAVHPEPPQPAAICLSRSSRDWPKEARAVRTPNLPPIENRRPALPVLGE